jgi:hypothetical protein
VELIAVWFRSLPGETHKERFDSRCDVKKAKRCSNKNEQTVPWTMSAFWACRAVPHIPMDCERNRTGTARPVGEVSCEEALPEST